MAVVQNRGLKPGDEGQDLPDHPSGFPRVSGF